MRVTLLKHVCKAPTEYSYAYVLITDKFGIADILAAKAGGKKIVFFGSTPESTVNWAILHEYGITANYICDVYCEYSFVNNGVQMRPYWELLAEPDKYYADLKCFITAGTVRYIFLFYEKRSPQEK